MHCSLWGCSHLFFNWSTNSSRNQKNGLVDEPNTPNSFGNSGRIQFVSGVDGPWEGPDWNVNRQRHQRWVNTFPYFTLTVTFGWHNTNFIPKLCEFFLQNPLRFPENPEFAYIRSPLTDHPRTWYIRIVDKDSGCGICPRGLWEFMERVVSQILCISWRCTVSVQLFFPKMDEWGSEWMKALAHVQNGWCSHTETMLKENCRRT